jgi:hypothetical protein
MESMEGPDAGFPPFPRSLRIPSEVPHSHGLDDWNEAITGEMIHVDLWSTVGLTLC